MSSLHRLPGGGNGNPLQYSCLGNLMDRAAWQATVHGITKNQTRINSSSSIMWLTGLSGRLENQAADRQAPGSEHSRRMCRAYLPGRTLREPPVLPASL